MKEKLLLILENITPWLLSNGLRIALLVIGGVILYKVLSAVVKKTVEVAVSPDKNNPDSEKKRKDTLKTIFLTSIKIMFLIIIGMMVLKEFNLDVGPLIASAGIVGLALGFGGQYLIKDIISGLFIILENQYRVGDIVSLDGTGGLVEDVTLRITSLRDLDGTVHHIQHGSVTTVSNLSTEYHRVNLNVGVAYETKLEHAIEVINKVGQQLAEDAEWKEKIITPPQFVRVDAFSASSIDMKILGDILPPNKWAVMGELRKRLKIEFDKEGIVIPFQQVVLHNAK
ncbi:MAG: mechanosensitive ion channel family protein [Bacteroidales bacterium]|jgi:small-conductance mechanosensitive channel|nr:mechanosensitive ion channel family protein [Bacteroidales bacterium]